MTGRGHESGPSVRMQKLKSHCHCRPDNDTSCGLTFCVDIYLCVKRCLYSDALCAWLNEEYMLCTLSFYFFHRSIVPEHCMPSLSLKDKRL